MTARIFLIQQKARGHRPRLQWHVASFLLLSFVALFSAGAVCLGAGRADVADAVMKRDTTALHALLQRKADVNAPQTDGATALHWAVYHDDLDATDLLIPAGAKVDLKNREGVTPLHLASLFGNSRMIDRLIQAGADAKQRGPAGETMLMLAARNGNPDAIKSLVAAGADVNAKEPVRGTTALTGAVEQRHRAAVNALLQAKADFSAKSGPAGLPRNYMAPRLNPDAVQAANRVRAEAAKAGRSYEEQLAFDAANGSIVVRRLGLPAAASRRQPPASAHPPAGRAPRVEGEDDPDGVVARPVGWKRG